MQRERQHDESMHYDNAPIVEASFSVAVSALSPERLPLLGVVGKHLDSQYAKVRQLDELVNSRTEIPRDVIGIAFSTEDDRRTVQARSDGFTFSQQAPYDRWETFIEGARSSWEIYKNIVGPLTLRELSVKYVNIIEIPLGIPLRELFNTYPALPDSSTLLTSLSMYYQYDLAELPNTRLSVLMVSLGRGSGKGRVLLDNTVTARVSSEAAMWDALPPIRKIKNDMFEAQLSEKVKAEYKNA